MTTTVRYSDLFPVLDDSWTTLDDNSFSGNPPLYQAVDTAHNLLVTGVVKEPGDVTGYAVIQMPSAPTLNMKFKIMDGGRDFSTNLLRVNFNGKKFRGTTDELELDAANLGITLLYVSETFGWQVVEGV